MGACFSIVNRTSGEDLQPSQHSWPTAKVISINGSLREYPVPVIVSQVLQGEETASSSSSSSSSSWFVCNSDRLYYDNYIPALDSEVELEANQIYFVLPRSKLERRLGATDMAALAVRASLALQSASTSSNSYAKDNKMGKGRDPGHRRHYKKARISPVLFQNENSDVDRHDDNNDVKFDFNDVTIGGSAYKGKAQQKQANGGLGISRSGGSVRKLQRYTSKRAKKAVRSFRLRLTTIDEGSVL